MPHPILFLGAVGAAGFGLMSATRRRLPPEERPFHSFPPGVESSEPLRVDVVSTSSTRRYKVTSFASADGRTYYVAELKGDVDWISYLQSTEGTRQFWGGNADNVGDVDAMKRDFNVGEGTAS